MHRQIINIKYKSVKVLNIELSLIFFSIFCLFSISHFLYLDLDKRLGYKI